MARPALESPRAAQIPPKQHPWPHAPPDTPFPAVSPGMDEIQKLLQNAAIAQFELKKAPWRPHFLVW